MEKIKLEVGKKYKNRKGIIISIISKSGNLQFPFISSVDVTYKENGKYYNTIDSCEDLI